MVIFNRALILSCILLFIASCGFHLKGTTADSNGLKHYSWQIVDAGDMTQPIKKALLRHKNVVIEENSKAAVIKVSAVNFDRYAQSINRYGGVDDYLYTLRVEAQVYYQHETWGEPMQIFVERNMTYRTDSLVVQEEERHLRDEMYDSAANDLVRRLYFLPDLK